MGPSCMSGCAHPERVMTRAKNKGNRSFMVLGKVCCKQFGLVVCNLLIWSRKSFPPKIITHPVNQVVQLAGDCSFYYLMSSKAHCNSCEMSNMLILQKVVLSKVHPRVELPGIQKTNVRTVILGNMVSFNIIELQDHVIPEWCCRGSSYFWQCFRVPAFERMPKATR